jgi:uncharacterized membrane protein YfcA
MSATELSLLLLLILAAATLYSSVGHGGASGYLAAMVLFGVAPSTMKPAALVMNIGVASIAAWKFWRAGHFRWDLLWPFAITSIPLAFVGGAIQLSIPAYRMIVAVALLVAAARFIITPHWAHPNPKRPPLWIAMIVGAIVGVVSGMTGVGGGIFLSPLLLFLGWAEARETAGVAAPFIVVNSIAGLLGHTASLQHLPPELPWMAFAAVTGGLVGSYLGARRATPAVFRRLLGVVLVVAAVKFLLEK